MLADAQIRCLYLQQILLSHDIPVSKEGFIYCDVATVQHRRLCSAAAVEQKDVETRKCHRVAPKAECVLWKITEK